MSRLGIYVHVPYCVRKCLYCDFYTEGANRAEWDKYVTAIQRELRHRLADYGSREDEYTLYIGGGTPSLMPESQLQRLADGITGFMHKTPIEFTIEVNPDDVTASRADAWRSSGVSRISMGVQSLVDSELRAIGRRHDAGTARKAYNILRPRFDNISLDIIFGLPYQTLDTLDETITGMLAMNPEHISAYSLMYEERTALTHLRDTGRIPETEEDITVEMYRKLSRRLAETDYEQYELSNYAHAGFRSQHNSAYWHGVPYIGLGAGAHSYNGSDRRTFCINDAASYTRIWNSDDTATAAVRLYQEEMLSMDEQREEMIMTRLRTREGLELEEYRRKYGDKEYDRMMRIARTFVGQETAAVDNGHLHLTRRGVMVSDEVISALF